MRGWFLFFIVSIGVGGFFALIVALGRTPGVASLLPPGIFYHWLVGHVDSALIIGLISFLIFLWHKVFESRSRPADLVLCGSGFFLVVLSALFGLGTALYNNYVPTIVHPVFFTGVALFGTGYLLVTLRFLRNSLSNILSPDPVRSVLSVSVVLSLLLLVSMVVSFITVPPEEHQVYFEKVYWIPGHIHQFVNACLLIALWLTVSSYARFKPAPWIRYLNLLLIPFPLALMGVQVVGLDPLSSEVRKLTTLGYAVGIGPPTILYALYLLARTSFRGGFYGNVLGLSLTFYLIGAGMGYLIVGSDLRIPAHYHAVIASILIAIMGITYRVIQEMGYVRELPRIVRLQPFIYWSGMILFVFGLFWAGVYGTPRKVFGTEYIETIKVYLFMTVMGLGSVLSVIGGAIFVLYVIYSILRPGKGVRHEAQREAQQEG